VRGEQVLFLRDVLRRKAVCENMAAAAIPPVEPLGVPAAQSRHAGRQRWSRCVDDQVEVRTHKAVRLASPRVSLDDAAELPQELLAIS
jgi:hypothetical protein